MDRTRCRKILLEGIDWPLTHRFLSMISDEQKAVLLACREVITADDGMVDKVVALVGPYASGPPQPQEPVTGRLDGVSFVPGERGGVLTLCVFEDGEYNSVVLFAAEKASDVMLDGAPIGGAELLGRLANHAAIVRAWADPKRYGAATRAEFTTVPPPHPPEKQP